jgi:molecular chaperone GrpE
MAQKNNELETKIKELEEKSGEYLLGWKRERADFTNYKKDEAERISGIIKYGNEDLVLKLLPILDNLLLAQSHINDTGLLQVIKQFEDFLKQEGIEAIKTIGEKFDPNLMEAVGAEQSRSTVEGAEADNNKENSQTVSEELSRGYIMHGKLIRPAKVKITK